MALRPCKECGTQISDKAANCPQCGAPVPKGTSKGALIVGAFFILIVAKMVWPDSPKPATPVAARSADSPSGELEACKRAIDQKKQSYSALLDKREFWEASLALGNCPDVMKDPALIAMRDGAQRLSYIDTAGSSKSTPDQRLTAISRLRSHFPEDAKPFVAVEGRLQVQLDARLAADRKRIDAAEKARKRKEGVSIGMSREDALASSWGKPRKVNTSTYTFGTHEQWVYDGGYLYFQNGVLTSIQN